jgi:hypothetical protein
MKYTFYVLLLTGMAMGQQPDEPKDFNAMGDHCGQF